MKLSDIDERIKLDPKTGCWIYTGPLGSGGYAQVFHEGQQWRLHRLAWTLKNGPIPEGLVLDHLCRVRSCCNPDHLEPVTDLENIRRSPIHNAAKSHCKNGHEFTAANTGINMYGGKRKRFCRTCQRAQNSAAAKKRRERLRQEDATREVA